MLITVIKKFFCRCQRTLETQCIHNETFYFSCSFSFGSPTFPPTTDVGKWRASKRI